MALPDLTTYNTKKNKGLISVQKIDAENYAIGTKRFNPDDGTALPNEVVGVTYTEVKKAIIDKEKEIVALKAFEADLLAST